MDLSIIIAHFDPGNNKIASEAFLKTLSKIESQIKTNKVEVIIADDGSYNNHAIEIIGEPISDSDGRTAYKLSGKNLEAWKKKEGLDFSSISTWIYLPKIKPMMSKARVGNFAIKESKASKLFFLDDDNYFILENSIDQILQLMKNYSLIFGQIKDSNGRIRAYSSNRVQGTTFAIEKKHLINAGLFGVWTEQVSCGIDSDLWWKLYTYFFNKPKLQAAYSSNIQTLDSCSKRWKAHIKSPFRKYLLRQLFNKKYNCKNYQNVKYNPSRKKSNWIEDLT